MISVEGVPGYAYTPLRQHPMRLEQLPRHLIKVFSLQSMFDIDISLTVDKGTNK